MKPARVVTVVLCLAPLFAAAPALNDPWGNAEEALNGAIWALGAKNLLERGPVESVRGAVVLPHGGTKGDGVYAHHPPLAVWLMVVPVALGGWEGGSRLLGLACAVASLVLLSRLLRRHFDERAALCGLAAAALSVFALRYGRLFTTLTLMTPLFLLGLELVERRSRWLLPVLAALVLSSWDGVVGAAVLLLGPFALSGARSAQSKGAGVSAGPRASGVLVFVLSLAFVVWHLVDATHGFNELLWQFRWRAAGDDVSLVDWLGSQARNVGEGLGPLTLLVLFAAPFLCRSREQLVTLAVLAAPGLVMELVFRQGSHKHAFWAFNLLLPAAFAVALAVTRLPRLAPALVAAQALLAIAVAAQRLTDEHTQNQLGRVAQQLPKGGEVAVLARGAFHPYVSWYAQARPITVRTLAELPAGEGPALVDTEHARALGCVLSEGARWRVLPLSSVRDACTRSSVSRRSNGRVRLRLVGHRQRTCR